MVNFLKTGTITEIYFKSDTSLPIKLIILDVNIKLENTVNSPAIPESKN